MVLVKPDQTFSRALLELTSNSIVATLGNIGYAFAQVNLIPDIDRENRTVAIQLQVVPGPRVNVRRVVFTGNTRTLRSEEQTSELQSLNRTSYAVYCLK